MSKRLILGGFLFYFLMTGIFYFLLLHPQTQKLSQLKKEIKQYEEKYSELEIFFKARKLEKEQKEKMEEVISIFKRKLIPEGKFQRLLTYIGKICQRYGIKIDSLSPLPPEEGKDLTRFSFRMKLTTTYNTFGTFINRVENFSPYLLMVDEFTISSKPNSPVPWLHEVELLLSSFGEKKLVKGRVSGRKVKSKGTKKEE